METEGRAAPGGAKCQTFSLGAPTGPYSGAVDLEAAPQPKLIEPKPATAHVPWIRKLSEYDRRESSWMHGARFG